MTEQLKTYKVWMPDRPYGHMVLFEAASSFEARREMARRYKVNVTEVCARRLQEGETS